MVVDELVVTLGLDPRNFTKGQKEALESFKKSSDEFERRMKNLEASGRKTGRSFDSITGAAEGLFSVLAGASMAKFARDTMTTVAATGRLAENIGVSVKELNAFGNMIERNGGNAEAAKASLKSFTDQVERFKNTGEASQDFQKFLGMVGFRPDDSALDAYFKFTKLAEAHRADPKYVNFLGGLGGLDQGSINQSLKGYSQTQADFESAKRTAATAESTKEMIAAQAAAVKLNQALVSVGVDIMTVVSPAFTAFANATSDWIEKNKALADSIGTVLAVAITLGSLKTGAVIGGGILSKLGLGGAAAAGGTTTLAVAGAAAVAGTLVVPTNSSEEPEIYKRDPVTGKMVMTDYGRRITGQGTGGSGAFKSPAEKAAFIRAEAAKRGINPDIALAVAKSEGFSSYNGDIDATGKPTSFGAFQLHYPGTGKFKSDGMGTDFTKATGLDARDPATEREQIQFALDHAKRSGWGNWYGWKGAKNAGIGGGGSTEISIGTITVNGAKDANGVARDINGELQKVMNDRTTATQANSGLN